MNIISPFLLIALLVAYCSDPTERPAQIEVPTEHKLLLGDITNPENDQTNRKHKELNDPILLLLNKQEDKDTWLKEATSEVSADHIASLTLD